MEGIRDGTNELRGWWGPQVLNEGWHVLAEPVASSQLSVIVKILANPNQAPRFADLVPIPRSSRTQILTDGAEI
jgi:hypothetical protein